MFSISCLLVLAVCLTGVENSSTESRLDRAFIKRAVEDAIRTVDAAYKYSREADVAKLRESFSKPSDLLAFLKRPSRDTRSAVRSAEYMENALRLIQERTHHLHKRAINATDLLSKEDLETVERLTGCAARVQPPSCFTTPEVNEYRTITSVCNNRKNSRLGAANTAFTRWLPANYDDGVYIPRGWDACKTHNGFVLPLVREVSNKILSTRNEEIEIDSVNTHFMVIFGQWTDHDLTLTPFSPSIRSFSNGINCDESCERASPCFPIKVPKNDPRIKNPAACIPFFRSAPACATGDSGYMFGDPNVRQQINSLTAFIDVGQVYSPEESLAKGLRNLTNDLGLMAVNQNFTDNGLELLPFTNVTSNMCATRRKGTNNSALNEIPCFVAGDERVNENIGLTAVHTLFVREHNRLARALRALNPHWSGEKLYQEARKIMGGYHQVITYRDYLPRILGERMMQLQVGPYTGYDENVDPRISNVFATAAFRFAHLTIQPSMFRLDENYNEHRQFPSVLLHNAFFANWRLVFEGGIDPLIRGLIGRQAKLNTQQHMLHQELRDRLFELTSHIALDLAALNMQRSRDHGVPGYNAWRKFCRLSQPKNVQELGLVLNNTDLAKRLIDLYGTPDNIDIWLGGISEPFVPGGRVGPLFACIIGTQFQRIRNGDRFWWENPGVFTQRQRESLNRVSLARIICDNTRIRDVPPQPFQYQPRGSGYTNCRQIPQFDLSPWNEPNPASNSVVETEDSFSDQSSRSQTNEITLEHQGSQDTQNDLDARNQEDPAEILDNQVPEGRPRKEDNQA